MVNFSQNTPYLASHKFADFKFVNWTWASPTNPDSIYFKRNSTLKDMTTKALLLKGPCVDGIYYLSRPGSPQIYMVQEWKNSYLTSQTGASIVSNSQVATKVFPTRHFLIHSQTFVILVLLIRVINFLFHESSLVSTHPLEVIYSDVSARPITSFDGFQYCIIFVDHYSVYQVHLASYVPKENGSLKNHLQKIQIPSWKLF